MVYQWLPLKKTDSTCPLPKAINYLLLLRYGWRLFSPFLIHSRMLIDLILRRSCSGDPRCHMLMNAVVWLVILKDLPIYIILANVYLCVSLYEWTWHYACGFTSLFMCREPEMHRVFLSSTLSLFLLKDSFPELGACVFSARLIASKPQRFSISYLSWCWAQACMMSGLLCGYWDFISGSHDSGADVTNHWVISSAP